MSKKPTICKHSLFIISILQEEHVFNITAIEKKAGLRKLRLHEFVNGKAKLDTAEALKVKEILKNAIKLQK